VRLRSLQDQAAQRAEEGPDDLLVKSGEHI
jgi:hypothetical protein